MRGRVRTWLRRSRPRPLKWPEHSPRCLQRPVPLSRVRRSLSGFRREARGGVTKRRPIWSVRPRGRYSALLDSPLRTSTAACRGARPAKAPSVHEAPAVAGQPDTDSCPLAPLRTGGGPRPQGQAPGAGCLAPPRRRLGPHRGHVTSRHVRTGRFPANVAAGRPCRTLGATPPPRALDVAPGAVRASLPVRCTALGLLDPAAPAARRSPCPAGKGVPFRGDPCARRTSSRPADAVAVLPARGRGHRLPRPHAPRHAHRRTAGPAGSRVPAPRRSDDPHRH